jgi:very-short-patch-repair endonuclease
MLRTEIVVLIAIVVLGLVIALIRAQKSPVEKTLPYRKIGALFSAAERSFLGVLDQALAQDLRAFGKVRIADVMAVTAMKNRTDWQRAFNRISAKHFDFVVCRSATLEVLCVIELDDQTHQRERSKRRDEFVLAVCRVTGLPLLRIPAQRSYSIQELRVAVSSCIDRGARDTPDESLG